MRIFEWPARKIIVSAAIIYLALGVVFFVFFNFLPDMKTYECSDPLAPNGYIAIFNNSFTPPANMNCRRRALTVQELINAPILTILWLPLVARKIVF